MTRQQYPYAERQGVVDEIHGQQVPDPYRWLEDPASPETEKWLAAQNDLWLSQAAELPDRDRLRTRGAQLAGVGMITAPMWRRNRRFFLRQTAGQEHAVLYVADADGREKAIVDPMAIDPSGLTTLDAWQPDLDGWLLSYQL